MSFLPKSQRASEQFLLMKNGLLRIFLPNQRPSEEKTPDFAIALSNADCFLLNASRSQLYQLGKNSQGQARREFEAVREIINGRIIFMADAIAPDGILQKNIGELVAVLGDVPESAIAEVNQLLTKDLGVQWII